MAINPAPMDQCTLKARCLTGPNQGLAYNANDPCPAGQQFVAEVCDCFPIDTPCANGLSGTLTTNLSSRAGSQVVTTFYPSVQGGVASGGSRVLIDGTIQVHNGSSFVDVGVAPYKEGDEYDGQIITAVGHSFAVAGTCEPIPNTSGCTKKAPGSSNSIMFSCGLDESDPQFSAYCSLRIGGYSEITDVREYPNANGPSASRYEIDTIRTNGFAETVSTNVAGATLILSAGTTVYLYGPGECLS
jgi:hypothetical protein